MVLAVVGVARGINRLKGQVCQLALSYIRVTYCTVISRRLGSPDGASLHVYLVFSRGIFFCGLYLVQLIGLVFSGNNYMAMEKLNAKKLKNSKKLSDIRLVSNLAKAGVSQDELDTMDRSARLNRWAELIVAEAGKPATAAALVALVTYNVEIEKEKLALEKLKLEAQLNWKKLKLYSKKKTVKLK